MARNNEVEGAMNTIIGKGTRVEGSMEVAQSLRIDGTFKGQLKASDTLYEQAIILTFENKSYIFTGCSHPGIVQIVSKAKSIHPENPIQLVAGGFHLGSHSDTQVREISGELKELGVDVLAPSHCTGERAIEVFRDDWGDRFLSFNLGDVYQI